MHFIRSIQTVVFAVVVAAAAGCGGSQCSDGDCSCPAGEHCDLTCTTPGGCRQECEGNCGMTCQAGTCRQECAAGSTCVLGCVGGGCMQQCTTGASCTFACEGGNCTQVCLGNPNCHATCTGQNCTSDSI